MWSVNTYKYDDHPRTQSASQSVIQRVCRQLTMTNETAPASNWPVLRLHALTEEQPSGNADRTRRAVAKVLRCDKMDHLLSANRYSSSSSSNRVVNGRESSDIVTSRHQLCRHIDAVGAIPTAAYTVMIDRPTCPLARPPTAPRRLLMDRPNYHRTPMRTGMRCMWCSMMVLLRH